MEEQENCCIFCGMKGASPFVGEEQDEKGIWSLACLESVCSLFRIPNFTPLQRAIGESNICSSCRQMTMDVDFNLRHLTKLIDRLEELQTNVLNTVLENSKRLRRNERSVSGGPGQDGEDLSDFEQKLYSYDTLVKIMDKKFREGTADVNVGVDRLKSLISLSSFNQNQSNTQKIPRGRAHQNHCTIQRKHRNCKEKPGRSLELQTEPERMFPDEFNPSSTLHSLDEGYNDVKIEPESDYDDSRDDLGDPEWTLPSNNRKTKTSCKPKKEDNSDSDDCSDMDVEKKYKHSPKKPKLTTVPNPNLSDKPPIVCELCEKSFSSEISLEKHKKRFHNEHHYCSFCKLDFKTLEEQEAHEDAHKASEQPFKCTVCAVVFTNSTNLKRHVTAAHTNQQFICDVCGVKLSSRTTLKQHVKIHSDSYVGFKCSICGHVFQQQKILENHMFKHSETKSFICEVCGKSFTYLSGLKRHRLNHDAEFPWKCKICGKGFSCKSFLARHEEIHSGTMSYECRFCSKKFRGKNNLSQHEKLYCSKDPDKKPKVGQYKGKAKEAFVSQNIEGVAHGGTEMTNAHFHFEKYNI